jgi:hypothetical protein
MEQLEVADDAAAVLAPGVLARLRARDGGTRCALCGVVVTDTGAAVAVTDGDRTLAVVTHPTCRVSGVALVDPAVLDEQFAAASTSRTHLAVGPAGHPAVLVTTVHAGMLPDTREGAAGGDAAVPALLGRGMVRQRGLPVGPSEPIGGWDATVHPDRLLEITDHHGEVFVAGDPGVAPGGPGWWRRASTDGVVAVLYVGGVHGDAGLTVEHVAASAARGELVGGGVRWRDRSGGHR